MHSLSLLLGYLRLISLCSGSSVTWPCYYGRVVFSRSFYVLPIVLSRSSDFSIFRRPFFPSRRRSLCSDRWDSICVSSWDMSAILPPIASATLVYFLCFSSFMDQSSLMCYRFLWSIIYLLWVFFPRYAAWRQDVVLSKWRIWIALLWPWWFAFWVHLWGCGRRRRWKGFKGWWEMIFPRWSISVLHFTLHWRHCRFNGLPSSQRELFAQHGKLENLFMQWKRKVRRRFHFGFVRFLSLTHALTAIKILDGIMVGGVTLFMALTRFSGSDVRVSLNKTFLGRRRWVLHKVRGRFLLIRHGAMSL